jgi:nuclear pore complex protein Nup62
LYRKVIEAQQSQSAADKALDYIDNQQKELEAVIAHYEGQVAGFTSDSSRSMPGRIPADKEREKMYASSRWNEG